MPNITTKEWREKLAELQAFLSKAARTTEVTVEGTKLRFTGYGDSCKGVLELDIARPEISGDRLFFVPGLRLTTCSCLSHGLAEARAQVLTMGDVLDLMGLAETATLRLQVWDENCPCDRCRSQISQNCKRCGGTGIVQDSPEP